MKNQGNRAEYSELFDIFKPLLTERQQEIFSLYFEEDLSLSEIGEELGVSRAAVHDSIKTVEEALSEYEKKLGLLERRRKTEKSLALLMERNPENKKEIEKIIEEL